MNINNIKARLRKSLGLFALRVGANLVFNSKLEAQKLKEKVNAETWFGSQIESGGHICGSVNPIGDYEIQSVINVLRHKKPNYNMIASERVDCYFDKWLDDGKHKKAEL